MRHSLRPVWLVLLGIASVQVGASFAKGLFDEISPTTMVWLRLTTSALVLCAVVRPSLRGRSREDWVIVLTFGTTLAAMNWAIYESFARIPLGVAVTIEFLGPLTLALVLSRRLRDLLWVGLAGAGVALLGWNGSDLTWSGVGFALLAGASWAAYILLSAATGRRWSGVDGLAIASLVGTLGLALPAILLSDGSLGSARILLIGAAVGLLSSVIPYSCELVALRSLSPRTFGVLMSMEPAAAALAAWVVIGETLVVPQWVAVGCVVVASIGATRTAARSLAREVPTGEPVIPLTQ